MRKMGNFRGLPVYLVNGYQEVINIDYDEEKMYVINGKLTYHGTQLADVYNGQLFDFDEDKFNELRRKSWNEDESRLLAKATGSAETRPQEERKPVKETVETPDRIVDEFLASWQDNIDNEIAMLKSAIAQMEDMLNAID
jgi:hypothetical protein